jgi:hypothetical protein
MPDRVKKVHPALKHAGYSTIALLPGEDPAAFKKLHQDLIAELKPDGTLEEDIVATIARLVWRKQNLKTFRIAQQTKTRWEEIRSEIVPSSVGSYPILTPYLTEEKIDPAERAALLQTAEKQARAELGPAYDFLEMNEKATVEQLKDDLEVQGALDATIDRCLKRLLFLRGLKSISTASASAPRLRLSAPPAASPNTPRSPPR